MLNTIKIHICRTWSRGEIRWGKSFDLYKALIYLKTVPDLQCFYLMIFQLYNGTKEIHIMNSMTY